LAGNLAVMSSLSAMSYITSPRRSMSMALKNFRNSVLLTFMGKEVAKRGLFQLQRTSGQSGG
jgi:hypothetical protein